MRDRSGGGGFVEIHTGVEPADTPHVERAPQAVGPGTPFAILVIGDFRGAELGAPHDDLPAVAERSPVAVDRDDLDRVLHRFRPSVLFQGTQGAASSRLDFRELADFHPDRLLARVPLLVELRQAPSGEEEGDAEPTESSRSGGVLDRILEGEPDAPTQPGQRDRDPPGAHVPTASELREYARRITEPYEAEEPEPDEIARQSARDRAAAEHLRRILHDARVQALEALWRGVDFLVRRLETGTALKVFLLQATGTELAVASRNGGLSAVLDRASRERLGGAPWSLAVVHRAFSDRRDDLETLVGLTETGAARGTPFVGEADPSLLTLALPGADAGAGAAAHAWAELREREGARHLGLALPRFLLRLPYADGENPCEEMDFQELEAGRTPEASALLRGHPGILVAAFLGEEFGRRGWHLEPGGHGRVDGLPLALHPGPDGVEALPPTELALDDEVLRSLAGAGFIGVEGRVGESSVRLGWPRSVHVSGTGLRGPWV